MNQQLLPKTVLAVGIIIGGLFAGCAPVISEEAKASAKAHYDTAVVYMEQGKLPDALRELTIAEKSNPYMAEIHNALGLAYHAKQQTDKALEHYQCALGLRNDFYEARNNYATLLIDLGRYDEAIKELQPLLDNPLYLTPHFAFANMGWAYHKQGNEEDAATYLKQALSDEPKFCRGYMWLAQVYESQSKYSKAVSQMTLFFNRCVEDHDVRKSIGNAFIAEANRQMGMLLVKDGQPAEAKPYLQECAKEEILNGNQEGLCQQVLQHL